jgi:hypothetical protein
MEKEFEKFRNQNPYKVPDGFFENITKQTLEKAHQRKKRNKVRKMLVVFSAAASVIILVAIGSVFFNQNKKSTETALVQPVTEEMVFEEIQPEEIFMTDSVEISENETMAIEPSENVSLQVSEDLLGNLIAGLSDEDLQQLEAVIKEELLITEILND